MSLLCPARSLDFEWSKATIEYLNWGFLRRREKGKTMMLHPIQISTPRCIGNVLIIVVA